MNRRFVSLLALLTVLNGSLPSVFAAESVVIVAPGKLTLTQALKQASLGTVITVSPGIYSVETGEVFPLLVPAGVEVKGEPTTKGKDIVIQGGGNFLSPSSAGQDVAMIAGNNSKITGLTVTNPNKRGFGLWIEGTSPEVAHNTFTGSKNDGVLVVGESKAKITENIFVKNSYDGITVLGKAEPVIAKNIFEDTGFALNIDGAASPRIEGNTIRNCVDGAVVMSKSKPIFRGNKFEYNRRSGISVMSEAEPNLGTPEDPGKNLFIRNGQSDINNAKRSATPLVVYGNLYSKQRHLGKISSEAKPQVVPKEQISPPPKPVKP